MAFFANAVSATPTLTASAVQRAGREALSAALRDADGWRDVTIEDQPIEHWEPVENASVLSVRPIDPERLRPLQRVWIDIAIGGRFQRTVAVDYRLRARRLVLRAKFPVPALAVIPNAALSVDEIDPFMPHPRLAPLRADAERIATRPLASGDLLEASATRPVDRIEPGDIVRIVLRMNGIVASDIATALSEANAGQRVRVLRRQTTRASDGIVEADGSILLSAGEFQ